MRLQRRLPMAHNCDKHTTNIYTTFTKLKYHDTAGRYFPVSKRGFYFTKKIKSERCKLFVTRETLNTILNCFTKVLTEITMPSISKRVMYSQSQVVQMFLMTVTVNTMCMEIIRTLIQMGNPKFQEH